MSESMHVWLLDEERWVIASSEADAWERYLAWTGGKREDFIHGDPAYTFERCPDAGHLSIVCNADGHPDDNGEAVSRTFREWAEREPPGYLCSENF